MITSDPFFIPRELKNEISAMAASGESIEAMSQRMADAKLEKLAAIKLLREATNSTLAEAKKRIHLSAAYRHRRTTDDAFHEAVFKAIEQESLDEIRARAS